MANGKGKRIVSKKRVGGFANRGRTLKGYQGGSRGGGSKSEFGKPVRKGKSKTVSPRLTQETRRKLLEQPDPASAFKDIQARRTMQDKPASLSIIREKRPYIERAKPPIPTKGGKTGNDLYRG